MPLPDKTLLDSLFLYKEGLLIRKNDYNKYLKAGDILGTINSEGYLNVKVKGSIFKVHRIIFKMIHGYEPTCIDHINGNRKDNRIENLREATISENQRNTKLRVNNSTGVKGVTYDKKCKKYRARCYYNNKQTSLGYFEDIACAKEAVQNFRNTHHGVFSNHG